MLDAGEADGLLVAKLDRLTRSVVDLGRLIVNYFDERAGMQLFSVADSIDTQKAAGRLVLNVLMSVAQWERETIVERTRDALGHKKSKGERVGQVPFGRRLAEDGKTLLHVPEEIALVAEMRRLYAEQGWTYQRIADHLTGRGVVTKNGRPTWAANTVRRILIQGEDLQHGRD